MDAIRKFFAKVKKIHFWLLCIFLLGMGIGTWFPAASGLKKKFNDNLSAAKGLFGQLDPVKNNNQHPNPEYSDGMNQLISQREGGVLGAWQIKWDHQAPVLAWPEKMLDDFMAHVNKYPVMEQIDTETNPEQEMKTYLREDYRNFIHAELPRLAEISGAKWKLSMERSAAGMIAPLADEMMGDRSVVDWDQRDQMRILEDFTWKDAKGEPTVPKTLDIYVAQENLSVLRSLMHIVKDTNGTADQRHLATIKKIEFLRIGLAASNLDKAGKVEDITSGDAPTDPMAGGMGMGMGMGYGMGGGMGGAGGVGPPGAATGPGAGAAGGGMGGGMGYGMGMGMGYGMGMGMGGGMVSAVDPLGNRYVNENFETIADGAELRDAVNKPTPEKAALAVAKRLPVRIRFVMDTRKIDQLLVACANAPLMLEVRQLRVNRPAAPLQTGDKTGAVASAEAAGDPDEMSDDEIAEQADKAAEGKGMGMGMGMGYGVGGVGPGPGMGMGMGYGTGPGGGMGMGMEGGGYGIGPDGMMMGDDMKMDRSQRAFPFDESVEIFGVVYIYNRPNEAVIKGTEAAAGAADTVALVSPTGTGN